MIEITEEFLKRVGCKTVREFKVRKRRELAALHKALGVFRLGCAFSPGYVETWDIEDVQGVISQIKRAQSVASWGR